MEKYYVESIIGEMAEEITRLMEQGVLSRDRTIVLYGLDTFSFAIRTILANLGFRVDSYISEDAGKVMRYKRYVKGISARYMNSARDLIGICSLEERLCPFDGQLLVISASQDDIGNRMEALAYRKNVNFFQVFDWTWDIFAQAVRGKRKMALKEIQNMEKEMLYYVDRFCTERKIRYWICGGTLLGAVRHKGFIPWDDDIDIFMPWNDYQRFLAEFPSDGEYGLISPGSLDRRKYYELFAKVTDERTVVRESLEFVRKIHPVSIDVFPLIGLPEDERKRLLFFEEYYEAEKKIWEDFYANNGDLGVYNKWYPVQEQFLGMFDFDASAYAGVLATGYKEKDCTVRRVYDRTLRMPFEDIEVNAAAGYTEYLDNLYGKDWMQVPGEDKRVSHHNMEAYWL